MRDIIPPPTPGALLGTSQSASHKCPTVRTILPTGLSNSGSGGDGPLKKPTEKVANGGDLGDSSNILESNTNYK